MRADSQKSKVKRSLVLGTSRTHLLGFAALCLVPRITSAEGNGVPGERAIKSIAISISTLTNMTSLTK
jgi:hypothetical protein